MTFSPMNSLPPEDALPHPLRLLQAYAYLRVIMGLVLLVLLLTGENLTQKQSLELSNTLWTTLLYIGVTALSAVVWPPSSLCQSQHRLTGFLLFDISCMLILYLASGGVASSLGYLLIIFIAITAILLRGRIALAYAAFCTVIILGDSGVRAFNGQGVEKDLFSSGILCAVLFLTALVFNFLTEKIRLSDLQAAHHSAYAEQLQQLAQAILARMRTGILVISPSGSVELINEAALKLLDLPNDMQRSPKLQQQSQVQALLNLTANHFADENSIPKTTQIISLANGQEVRVNLSPLRFGKVAGLVLYIEDNRTLNQQVQQLKLASLGKLTASIAHEIRNPLGAISHAAQLLEESALSAGDARLLQIILQQSARVNQIIENTLSLSRQKSANSVMLNLTDWLPQFCTRYQEGNSVELAIILPEEPLWVRFDDAHLTQILTNLCDNGARYNARTTQVQAVSIHIGHNANSETCYLDVRDQGPGVSLADRDQIFDPFFTTDTQGSGLGLYICKELCEINQATLSLLEHPGPGAWFRIDFSHPLRVN